MIYFCSLSKDLLKRDWRLWIVFTHLDWGANIRDLYFGHLPEENWKNKAWKEFSWKNPQLQDQYLYEILPPYPFFFFLILFDFNSFALRIIVILFFFIYKSTSFIFLKFYDTQHKHAATFYLLWKYIALNQRLST